MTSSVAVAERSGKLLVELVPSIRDTIAFPKTQRGQDPLTGAPAPLSPEQLAELGLAVTAP